MNSETDDSILEEAAAWRFRIDQNPSDRALAARLQTWLSADPRHQSAWDEIDRTWAVMGAVPRPAVSRLATGRPRQARRRAFLTIGVAAAAATAVLLIRPPSEWAADHRTGVGEIRPITLSDGSKVHLNGNSAIVVDFSADTRRVRLIKGEAAFTVVSGPRRFIVAAADGTSEALGTAWTVQLTGDGAVVAVTENDVLIRNNVGGEVIASAGQGARYSASTLTATQSIDVEAATAWQRGKLIFVDRPLGEVVEGLGRHHPARLVILDGSIRQMKVNGVFDLSQPERALAAIETSLGLSSVNLAGTAILLYR